MTITDRISQARTGRNARRTARAQRTALARELAAYRTPAERMEIELLAGRSSGSDAAQVLDILDQLSTAECRCTRHLAS